MQFNAIAMFLLAATVANALPEPGWKQRLGKPNRPGKPNKPSKPNNGNGGSSDWKWEAAGLGMSVADTSISISTTFAGNKDNCEPLKKGAGCWKGYCWSACNEQDPTWWAWMARTKGGEDWVQCSADSECVGKSFQVSAEGCGC